MQAHPVSLPVGRLLSEPGRRRGLSRRGPARPRPGRNRRGGTLSDDHFKDSESVDHHNDWPASIFKLVRPAGSLLDLQPGLVGPGLVSITT